jgi:hypothetical protein
MSISIVGDLCVHSRIEIDASLGALVPNLECAPLGGERVPEGKVFVEGYEQTLAALTQLRVAGVTIANNHIIDGGPDGLVRVLADLRKAGIPHAGHSGSSINLTTEWGTFAILSYVCSTTVPDTADLASLGIGSLSLERIVGDLRCARSAGRIPIVCLHWGQEEVSWPTSGQITLARAIVDGGAEAVIGHHQHVVLPWERYKQKVIAYGVGNFAFDNVLGRIGFSNGERAFTKRQGAWNLSGAAVRLRGPDATSFDVLSTEFDPDARLVRVGRPLGPKIIRHGVDASAWRGVVAWAERQKVRAYQFAHLKPSVMMSRVQAKFQKGPR